MSSWVSELANSESVRKIRFGGILGKLTLLGGVIVVGACFELRFISDWHVQLAAVLLSGLALLVVIAIVGIYAFRYPQQATLEGSEILAYSQLQMATKQNPQISTTVSRSRSELKLGTISERRGDE